MEDLLKSYLENRGSYRYHNVVINNHNVDGHLCIVQFTYGSTEGEWRSSESERINIWEMLEFVYSKCNLNK